MPLPEKICLRNLPFNISRSDGSGIRRVVNDKDIRLWCESFGVQLVDGDEGVYMLHDQRSGNFRGIAMVKPADGIDVAEAMEKLKEQRFAGREVWVDLAIPKRNPERRF